MIRMQTRLIFHPVYMFNLKGCMNRRNHRCCFEGRCVVKRDIWIFLDKNEVKGRLTHAGSVLRFGHASWAAVETLVSSLCVTALLVSRTHISHALIDVCKSANHNRAVMDCWLSTGSTIMLWFILFYFLLDLKGLVWVLWSGAESCLENFHVKLSWGIWELSKFNGNSLSYPISTDLFV